MNEKQASVSKTQPSEDIEDNEENNGSRHGSCGCLWLLCLRNNDESQQRYDLLHQPGEIKESWVMKKAKKLREISEVLAGPKWKSFIRRFSIHKKRTRMRFHYDPQSYALNFDDKEIDGAHADHHFAARFAAPLQSTL